MRMSLGRQRTFLRRTKAAWFFGLGEKQETFKAYEDGGRTHVSLSPSTGPLPM